MSTNQEVTRKDMRNPQSLRGKPVVAPTVDVFENKDGYLVLADLPGVSPDRLNVRLEQGELLVEGTWDSQEPDNPVAREFRPTDFRRLFLVPDAIDAEGVEATLTNGVLHVKIPKSEAVKPRQIKINVG